MNADGILQRIEKDAREAAAAMLKEAQLKAEEIRAASDGRIARGKEAALAQARGDALALDDRMQRMAQLEARKEMLAAKRVVLDEAFARALDQMAAMPEDKVRAFGLSVLLESAGGDEVLIPDAASAWADDAFVKTANEALAKAGKPGQITLAGEKRNLGGGFVLAKDGMEIDCSYKAALQARRMDVEAEAAAVLFGA